MLKLTDFYADWCGPCQIMKPVFKELEEAFRGKIEFASVNVDEESETAQKLGIMSIPAFLLEKDGKELDRKVGALPKETLESWLNYYL